MGSVPSVQLVQLADVKFQGHLSLVVSAQVLQVKRPAETLTSSCSTGVLTCLVSVELVFPVREYFPMEKQGVEMQRIAQRGAASINGVA